MKRLFFIPIFFFLVLLSMGQTQEVTIDYDYFLLGTLGDYMGRQKHENVVDKVDEYSIKGESYALFIHSIFKDEYQDLKITTNEKVGRLTLESKELAKEMNEFYSFKPSGRRYHGKEDLTTLNLDSLTKTDDFLTKYFSTVYTGSIKEHIFKSDIERLSFIAGAYSKSGGKNDSTYYIRLSNSISKARELTEQLKNVKCTNVEYIILKDFIPVGHRVYFTPTNVLKEYFDVIKQKRVAFSER